MRRSMRTDDDEFWMNRHEPARIEARTAVGWYRVRLRSRTASTNPCGAIRTL
jgi:hypothetical protein